MKIIPNVIAANFASHHKNMWQHYSTSVVTVSTSAMTVPQTTRCAQNILNMD